MSLYKSSSLVMIPSAYKDGKLYSIRPTDGSGDFTFSRGSNLAATRVDVNGLIEKGRENKITYSNDFQNASWTLGGIQSITTGQSGYDGSSDASLVIPDLALQGHQIGKGTETFTGLQTYSIYAKNGGYDLQLRATGIGSTNIWVSFDLTNGVLGTSGSGQIDSSITSVGGGWYRCSMTFTTTSSPYMGVYIVPDGASAGQGEAFSGDGTSGLYVQDAQVEVSLVATDYIETGASTAQAGILEDMPRLDYSGSCPALLLEPQRTNAIADSEYFGTWNSVSYPVTITSNSATSPEGTLNATLITPTSGSNRHAIRELNVTAVSGTTYTLSAFFKKAGSRYVVLGDSGDSLWRLVTADLDNGTITDETNATGTIEPYANDWYRITCTFTITNSVTIQTFLGASPVDTNTSAPTFDDTSLTTYAYGAQLEIGASYPTSYIPTYGSSVTRSSESQATDYGVLGGGQVGSIFVEFERFAIDTSWTGAFTQLVSSGGSEEIRLHFDAPTAQARWRDANNSYIDIGGAISTAVNSRIKTILTSDGNTIKVFANGSKIGNDYTIVNPLEFDKLVNLQRGAMNVYSEMYFPTALTDSECIALTTL